MCKTTQFILVFLLTTLFACDKKANQNSLNKAEKEYQAIDKKKLEIAKRAIDSIMYEKADHGFNGNVLVAMNNQIIYENSFGLAQQKKNVANAAQTRFQLASISKTFTAVAIMQLIEQGKCDLKQTVQEFYPKFPYAGVTIYSLLTHRSGLPFYQYTFDKLVRKKDLYPVNKNIMAWFEQTIPTPPKFNEPDRFFSYNNTNYAILASLVEKISGLSYASYLQKNIFDPLGMHHSFVMLPNTNKSDSTIAHGHQFGGELPTDWFDYVQGDKGVYSTTADMLQYYKGLHNGKILKKSTFAEMCQPRSFEKDGKRNYGYGFRLSLNDDKTVKAVFHSGWWKGFNTMFFTVPKSDIVIIILGNKYSKTPYDIRSIWAVLDPSQTVEVEEEEEE